MMAPRGLPYKHQERDSIRNGIYFCILVIQTQIPAMAKSGENGSIIVNSAMEGSRVSNLIGDKNHTGVYAASKAGLDMLMKYAAIEASTMSRAFVADLTL